MSESEIAGPLILKIGVEVDEREIMNTAKRVKKILGTYLDESIEDATGGARQITQRLKEEKEQTHTSSTKTSKKPATWVQVKNMLNPVQDAQDAQDAVEKVPDIIEEAKKTLTFQEVVSAQSPVSEIKPIPDLVNKFGETPDQQLWREKKEVEKKQREEMEEATRLTPKEEKLRRKDEKEISDSTEFFIRRLHLRELEKRRRSHTLNIPYGVMRKDERLKQTVDTGVETDEFEELSEEESLALEVKRRQKLRKEIKQKIGLGKLSRFDPYDPYHSTFVRETDEGLKEEDFRGKGLLSTGMEETETMLKDFVTMYEGFVSISQELPSSQAQAEITEYDRAMFDLLSSFNRINDTMKEGHVGILALLSGMHPDEQTGKPTIAIDVLGEAKTPEHVEDLKIFTEAIQRVFEQIQSIGGTEFESIVDKMLSVPLQRNTGDEESSAIIRLMKQGMDFSKSITDFKAKLSVVLRGEDVGDVDPLVNVLQEWNPKTEDPEGHDVHTYSEKDPILAATPEYKKRQKELIDAFNRGILDISDYELSEHDIGLKGEIKHSLEQIRKASTVGQNTESKIGHVPARTDSGEVILGETVPAEEATIARQESDRDIIQSLQSFGDVIHRIESLVELISNRQQQGESSLSRYVREEQ